MAGNVAPVSCPKCQGPMWDNIASKKNPKAPDYACKDKQGCGAGVWLKDSEKAALGATSRNGPSPNRPPVVLDKMMRECVKAAQEIGNELFNDGTPGLDFALTLNMATTLYISRCKSEGILHVEKAALEKLAAKAAEAKAEAERKAAEERARMQPQPEPEYAQASGWPLVPDSDLPF